MHVVLDRHPIWTALALVLAMTFSAFAQSNPGTAAAGMSPVLTLLFKDYEAFSATAEVELSGPTDADAMRMPMRFLFLNGDMRTELDMSDVKGPSVDDALANTLKQIGMNRVVTILQPSRGQTLVLYPNHKAYVLLPDKAAGDKSSTERAMTRKTKLGEEIVLGMSCTKSQVTLAEGPDRDLQVKVWEAPALRGFPVQIEMQQAGGTMTVRYRDVSFAAPGPERFVVPKDFKKHDGVPSILRESTRELLESSPQP